MPNVVQSNQFQLVQDLLKRQDEALDQLAILNDRVEEAIKEVNAFRGIDENEDISELDDVVKGLTSSAAKAA